MKFILGKKIGMSQVFNEQGKVIPVTLVEAGPCWVVQVKNQEKDDYSAVQIGFEAKKDKHTNKAQQGHFKKAGLKKNFRYLKEFKAEGLKVGDKIDVGIFNPGEIIKVSGISKGKGFQGVVKRHGFAGFPATHGTKHGLRAPGSIGSAFPQRVFKGKKMAGRMGSDRVTVQGLKVVQIDKENNLLAVKGAVPGKRGILLEIVATKEIEMPKEEKKEEKVAEKKEEVRKEERKEEKKEMEKAKEEKKEEERDKEEK
jgi:large subunit ribosomal protein L3